MEPKFALNLTADELRYLLKMLEYSKNDNPTWQYLYDAVNELLIIDDEENG